MEELSWRELVNRLCKTTVVAAWPVIVAALVGALQTAIERRVNAAEGEGSHGPG